MGTVAKRPASRHDPELAAAYQRGKDARSGGQGARANPYPPRTPLRNSWHMGWNNVNRIIADKRVHGGKRVFT